MSVAMGWGDLPSELLLFITRRLHIADVIRVRAVCYHWAWSLGKTCGRLHPTLPSPQNPFLQYYSSPCLVLPKASGKDADSCTFLSLSEDRCYTIPSLPQIADRRIVGSSDGWVVTVDPLFTPRLLNPLTRQELSLPSLSTLHTNLVPIYSEHDGSLSAVLYTGFGTTYPIDTITETFCDNYLTKIILTSSPLRGGIVVALCTFPNQESFLASAAPGDETWSLVYKFEMPDDFEAVFEAFEDVLYHEGDGMLYALTDYPAVMILKRNNGSWDLHSIVAAIASEPDVDYLRRYIIFSHGELLQITRYMDEENEGESGGGGNYRIISNTFKILKFDQVIHDRHIITEEDMLPLCRDDSCWVRVDSLGDQSLFLGYNNSFSMNCGDDKIGLQRNAIYFADYKNFGESERITCCDAGVYDLEEKTIESLCLSNCERSFWYIPTRSLWE